MQWGEPDFHPDTDWQDLFFDLLFAGGAFCAAALLAESLMNGQAVEGMEWFCVMFLCVAMQWAMRVHYCSRFASTSVFHAIIMEELEFLFIALAVWHIPLSDATVDAAPSTDHTSFSSGSSYGGDEKNIITLTPVEQMASNTNGCAFGFSLFLGLNSLIYLARWSEILTNPFATPGAKTLARFSIVTYTSVACVFLSGAIVCKLVPDEEPGWWCLLIWSGALLTFIGFLSLWTWNMSSKVEEEAQSLSVPMCVDYIKIRVGEWTMVMLGETVLSLLGVPLESDITTYLMFMSCMLIAGNLQFHRFIIHPIHADDHVLKLGQFSFKGLLYLIWATVLYATFLVGIGASAKVLVKKATYGEVFSAANWCLCGGLAAAFVSNMVFAALHGRTEFEFHTVFKGATIIFLLALACAELKPSYTVVIVELPAILNTALDLVMYANSHLSFAEPVWELPHPSHADRPHGDRKCDRRSRRRR
mmetsp:Transcript_39251/g.87767  ORF Transcript_39251/g.87767 Transcript_39251/m.87767 type:complete len:474 (-) Transcript_39251:273-1694(-)